MGGLLLLLLFVWGVVGALMPGLLYTVSPNALRTTKSCGIAGWPMLALMTLVPLADWTWFGLNSSDAPGAHLDVAAGFAMGVFVGLPISTVSVRAWRLQRSLVLAQAPADIFNNAGTIVVAVDVVPPTPAPEPIARVAVRERRSRALRITRTLLVTAATSSYVLARILQFGGSGNDIPAPLGAFLVSCAFGAAALTVVLRTRHRWADRGHSLEQVAAANHWNIDRVGAEALATRFPQLPLLMRTPADSRTTDFFKAAGPAGHGRAVPSRWVVWGVNGQRRWWAVDQSGESREPDIFGRSGRRATIVVALPGCAFPRLMVAGVDLVGVGEWLADSQKMESVQWNHRQFVGSDLGDRAFAHAVLHPRAMEHLLATVPDGMTLLLQGDALALWREGPLTGLDLLGGLHCLMGLADLVPGWLLTDYACH